jgi:hypothetical protein
MAEFICRDIRGLMVQAKNNRRRLELLFWFSARLSAGIGQLKEHIKKLERRP